MYGRKVETYHLLGCFYDVSLPKAVFGDDISLWPLKPYLVIRFSLSEELIPNDLYREVETE